MRLRLILPMLCCIPLCGQQAPPENPQPKPAQSVSATTRLLNAKTVFVKKIAGGDIAFDIMNNAIIAWPRYIVVDDEKKADLLIEVSSPAPPKKNDEDSKTSVSGGSGGRDPRTPVVPTNTYSDTDVKVFVRDAHTRAILWSGREPTKEAFRQAKTDENIIEAAQKLFHKLQDRVEPPAASPATPQ